MEIVVTQTEFWTGRKVLVTGHTGFKGSWLACSLIGLVARSPASAFLRTPSPECSRQRRLSERVDSVLGDVRDPVHSRRLSRYDPEIVFHLAAQPLVRLSYEDPGETFDTNVMGLRICSNFAARPNL